MSLMFVNVFGTHGTTSSIMYLSKSAQHCVRESIRDGDGREHSSQTGVRTRDRVPAGYPHSVSWSGVAPRSE